MVLYIPERPSFGKEVAQSLGRGLEQGIADFSSFQKQMALERAKRGLDIAFEQKKLQARDPQFDQTLDTSSLKPEKPQNLSDIELLKNQNISPQKINAQEQDIAQEGLSQKLYTAKNYLEREKEIAREAAKRGVLLTSEQIQNQMQLEQSRIKEEKLQYDEAAKLGEQIISNAYTIGRNQGGTPEISNSLTPNLLAKFKQRAADLAFSGLRPVDIQRILAKEAQSLVNAESNVRDTLKRQVGASGLKAIFTGKKVAFDQQIQALKQTLKPFLDQGYYEEARAIASKAGFGAEEVESALSNLSEKTLTNISNLQRVGRPSNVTRPSTATGLLLMRQLNDKEYSQFKNNLFNVLSQDPNANLILLRKKYMEDHGVDWRSFKRAMNELPPELQEIYTKDQEATRTINEPPLSLLEALMYQFGIHGK